MITYRSVNPYNLEELAQYPLLPDSQVQEKTQLAEGAFLLWRSTPLQQKTKVLHQLATLLLEQKRELGRLISLEMGKPLVQSIAEIEKCARCCSYFAENGPAMLEDEIIAAGFSKSLVRFSPLGVVLGIYPWNYPFWQVIRFAAPALLAGNVLLMKHAPNVPQCALAIERLFLEAGYPYGVLQSLFIDNEQAGNLIGHPTVKAVTLTGSETAGKQVAAKAGTHLKKSVLELGGSDPFIVFADADLNQAAEHLLLARFGNTGQSCIATKRLLLDYSIADEFLELFLQKLQEWKAGDPLSPETRIGPLARPDLREKLEQQTARTLELGAQIYWKATVPDNPCFFPPMILTQVDLESPAAKEELFGPVLPVFLFRNEKDAVFLANKTNYGLGASVWTNDTARMERMADLIESGSCFFNEQVRSTPELPFGGIKHSGYGRELSAFGLRELVNVRTLVWH